MGDRNTYTVDTPIVTSGMARKMTAIGGTVSIVTGDLTLNKTVGMFRVPAGFTVVNHSGGCTDMDTNASPTAQFTIGVAGTASLFLAADSAPRTGAAFGAIARTGIGYRFDADTEILLTTSTASATAAAGTVTYFLEGYFD